LWVTTRGSVNAFPISLAQSALYAPRSPIRILRQAVVRLGLKTR
jgi:HD-like signal output (HDOD) protein